MCEFCECFFYILHCEACFRCYRNNVYLLTLSFKRNYLNQNNLEQSDHKNLSHPADEDEAAGLRQEASHAGYRHASHNVEVKLKGTHGAGGTFMNRISCFRPHNN